MSAKVTITGFFFLILISLSMAQQSLDEKYQQGQEFFDNKNYEQAQKIFADLAQAQPQNAQYQFFLARTYLRLSQFDEAVKYLEKAVSLNDTSAFYHLVYGSALFQLANQGNKLKAMGRAKKGRQEFERVIALDPNNLPARYSLMQYYYHAPGLLGGDKEKAIQLMNEMTKIAPDSLLSIFAKVEILLNDDKLDEAQQQLIQSTAKLKTKNDSLRTGYIYNTLGYKYLGKNNCDKAKMSFKKYVELAPEDPNAHDSLGEAYYKCGELDPAIAEYRKALSLNPDFANSKKMLEKLLQEK